MTSSDPSQRLAQYEEWIAQGFHGEMGFLARQDRLARRRDLAEILPDVRAIVVTSLPYWPGQRGFPPEQTEASRGSVSCYAWGDDYHEILGDKMRSLATWLHTRAGGAGRWYVDTGAVMERDLGERAGLGFIGKHSLLISPKIGSGFFLGGVLTTLPLPPDTPTASRAGCGKCTKCLTACPTNAFDGPYVLDARHCISYLTIELKGSIPLELRPMMGMIRATASLLRCVLAGVSLEQPRIRGPRQPRVAPLRTSVPAGGGAGAERAAADGRGCVPTAL